MLSRQIAVRACGYKHDDCFYIAEENIFKDYRVQIRSLKARRKIFVPVHDDQVQDARKVKNRDYHLRAVLPISEFGERRYKRYRNY